MATIPEALAIALKFHQVGQLQAAEQIYRQILQTDPQYADAWHFLGQIAFQVGKAGLAEDYFVRSIASNPHVAAVHVNLGLVHQSLGRWDDAVASYRRALEIEPSHAGANNDLGNVLQRQMKWDEAEAAYRRALEIKPDLAVTQNNLGCVLRTRGNLADAIECFRRAIEFQADLSMAWHNLGLALHAEENFAEASASIERALQIEPSSAQYLNGLGVVRQAQKRYADAARCFQRAVEVQPNHAEAWSNLGNGLMAEGRLDEAVDCYGKAIQAQPDYVIAHSNVLYCAQYQPGATLEILATAHAEWEKVHASRCRSAWPHHANARDPDRPIRLGFVSADFGQHPVSHFLIRVLESFCRQQFEMVCYSNSRHDDRLTSRFRAVAQRWHQVQYKTDDEVAEQIRSDGIDILFDLSGHTAQNRLLVFARKPAPIQITWIGYEGTTGLTAMDYLIGDQYVIRPHEERYYCEKVLRMPDSYVCYDPPEEAGAVGPLPAIERGYATFGSFNNPAKITPQLVEVWARVLRRVPQARLKLKFRRLDEPKVASRFLRLFDDQGIDPDRLQFSGYSPYAEFLEEYNGIDIALDTFPFSGGTTTCEALWMGAPVVTCPGPTFAGRHGLSYLSNIGLSELIAPGFDHYVEIAVALAYDLPRLAAIRARLREQMATSNLCDGPRFAAHFTALMRQLWREWIGCAT